jgi:hypothetical protein
LPTEGAKYVYTVMALSCGVPPARTADQLNLQAGVVDEWTSRPKVRELAQAIRDARARIPALLRANAGVLKVGVNTLERLLHRLYRLEGRTRRRAQRFVKRVDLAATLGLTQDEFLKMFQLEGTMSDLARRRAAHPRQKNVKPHWRPQKKPRSACLVCGLDALRHGRPYCSEMHSNLHRVVRSLRKVVRSTRNNKISRQLFLMIAMSCGLSVGAAARQIGIPEGEAASWTTDAFLATVARIREARGKRSSVLAPVAQVFGWGISTVERYLYHRTFPPGRTRSSTSYRFRRNHVQRLADALGIAFEDCLHGLRARLWEDHVRTMHQKGRAKQHRIRTGTLGQRGNVPSQCPSFRATVALGLKLGRTPSTEEMAGQSIVWALGQRPRAFLVAHARRCRDCGDLLAAFLHRYLDESTREIGRALKVSQRTARRAIARGLPRLSRPWVWRNTVPHQSRETPRLSRLPEAPVT